MAYTLYQFGSTTLPTYNTDYDISALAAMLNLTQTASGAFDNDGADRNRQTFPQPLSYKAIVATGVLSTNRSTLDALRASVGTRNKLYRVADDNSDTQWCYARQVSMPQTRPYGNRNHLHEITINFQQLSPWCGGLHGVGWTLDSGVVLDDARTLDETPPTALTTGVTLITINNAGNLPSYDALIQVVAASSSISSLTIWNLTTECRLYYAGTLVAGQTLQIDTGACSVLNNGANDYTHLTVDYPVHKNERWMEFAPGDNQLAIVRFGGGSSSTISFVFYDIWA